MNPADVPIPERLKRFPLWRGRFLIHYTVFTLKDGTPDFKVVHEAHKREALTKFLCHLCGQRLEQPIVFIGGPKAEVNRIFFDGPMHEECALYATKVCPYLANADADHSKAEGKCDETLIEWTNRRTPDGTVVPGKTFNLWIGCTKISPACDNCYAERDMAILHKMVEWGPENEGGTRTVVIENTRGNPRKWAKKAAAEGNRPLVFAFSLADVFEVWKGPMLLNAPINQPKLPLYDLGRGVWTVEEPKAPAVPKLLTMDEARRQMFRIMARTAYGLDYLVLTKRPGHARTLWKELLEVYRDELELAVGIEPRLKPALEYTRRTGMMPNIWPGTTAEAQRYVRQRFDELCGIPAVRRFASIEPQVEPVEIGEYLSKNADLPGSDGLHWIIQGGESGNADNIRPFHPDWARKTRDECAAAGVPYFLKQWGEVLPADHATVDVIDKPHHLIWHEKSIPVKDQTEMANMQAEQKAGRVALPMIGYRVGKKSAGRTLDGRTHDAIPVSVF